MMKKQKRKPVRFGRVNYTPMCERHARCVSSHLTQNEFHRSNTISSFRPTSATPGSSNRKPMYSPLERFHDAKNEISLAFSYITNCLVEAQTFLKEALCKGGEEKMESLMEKTKGIEEILDRDHMKVIQEIWRN